MTWFSFHVILYVTVQRLDRYIFYAHGRPKEICQLRLTDARRSE